MLVFADSVTLNLQSMHTSHQAKHAKVDNSRENTSHTASCSEQSTHGWKAELCLFNLFWIVRIRVVCIEFNAHVRI